MITTLSSFIHFRLYTDCQDQDFLSCPGSDPGQNQDGMRFFFDEMKQDEFFFDGMEQNQIFFS